MSFKNKFISDSADYQEKLGYSNSEQMAELTDMIGLNGHDATCRQTGGTGMGIKQGIALDYGTEFQDVVVVDNMRDKFELVSQMKRNVVGDADTSSFNINSSGIPAFMATIWTKDVVEQMQKIMTIDQVADNYQQGAIGTQEVFIPTASPTGQLVPYSDASNDGLSSYNLNYVNKNIVRLQTGLQVGDLQSAVFSLAKMNVADMSRKAVMVNMAQNQNDIFFRGYKVGTSRVFGVINDPDLHPFNALPTTGRDPDGNPSSSWLDKSPELQQADFLNDMLGPIAKRTMGRIDTLSKGKFILPPEIVVAITKSNANSVNIADNTFAVWLKKTYPNIEIVSSANMMDGLNGYGDMTNIAMLVMADDMGENPFKKLFTDLITGHGAVREVSSYQEKISCGIGGSFCKYPALVQGVIGI